MHRKTAKPTKQNPNAPMGRRWPSKSETIAKRHASLSDAELLSIIIGSVFPGESLDIAKKMLSNCGNSLCEFWKFGVSDLQKIQSIGEKRAVKISAMFALARRRNESEVILKDKIKRVKCFWNLQISDGDLPYEEFWILLLNKATGFWRKSGYLKRNFRDCCWSEKDLPDLSGTARKQHHPWSQSPERQYQPSEADNK